VASFQRTNARLATQLHAPKPPRHQSLKALIHGETTRRFSRHNNLELSSVGPRMLAVALVCVGLLLAPNTLRPRLNDARIVEPVVMGRKFEARCHGQSCQRLGAS